MDPWKLARLLVFLGGALVLLGMVIYSRTQPCSGMVVTHHGVRYLWLAQPPGESDVLRSLDPFEEIGYAWRWKRTGDQF